MARRNYNSEARRKRTAAIEAALRSDPGAKTSSLAAAYGVTTGYVGKVKRRIAADAPLSPSCRSAASGDAAAVRKVPSSPTDSLPGSEAKIRVLAARLEAGEDLWHPEDGRADDGASRSPQQRQQYQQQQQQ